MLVCGDKYNKERGDNQVENKSCFFGTTKKYSYIYRRHKHIQWK